MLKNYLLIAIRNIKKAKTFSLINIAGLTIGMACCMLITLYVLNELSYDRFNKNSDRIFRLGLDANISGLEFQIPLSNAVTALVMKEDYPEVENFARIYPRPRLSVSYKDKKFYENRIIYGDNSLFEVFTFPFVRGNPKSALLTKNTIVITEDIAKKYFGDQDPIGKNLSVNNYTDFVVTGVVKNIPKNSHFTFDMVCSFETLYARNPERMKKWMPYNYYTYLLLKRGYDYKLLEEKFPALIDKYMGELLRAIGNKDKYFLQPLKSIHLHSHMRYELRANGDITYIYVFSSIAVFILLIACINFMNLSTARSASRAKEVGMRKVLGAVRGKLIKQFITESMLYSIFGFGTAVVLVKLAVPFLRTLSGNELSPDLSQFPRLVPAFIVLFVFVGLAAGSYPAFFLSSFRPVKVLKGVLSSGASGSRFRNIMVTIQFTISVTLIIGTVVVLKQLSFMKNKRLGFDKEHIVVIPMRSREIRASFNSIKSDIMNYPGIISVALTSHIPGNGGRGDLYIPEGHPKDQSESVEGLSVDEDYIPTLNIEITSGRNFSKDKPTDKDEAVIINETAAKQFGWDNALGRKFYWYTSGSEDNLGALKSYNVIGVVKDFHILTLHHKINPMIIRYDTDDVNHILLKINPQDISGTIEFLREKFSDFDPDYLFDYEFLDRSFDARYRSDEKMRTIVSYFTVFAIFVACLGLFGMASYMAEQRKKEIGIRKALGASSAGIIVLLNREVNKLLFIANILSWPVAYYILHKWLEGFAYRTSLNAFIFLLSGAMVFLIGYSTTIYQSLKAAMTNPVEAIRRE